MRGVRDNTFKEQKEGLAFTILHYDGYLPCEDKKENGGGRGVPRQILDVNFKSSLKAFMGNTKGRS